MLISHLIAAKLLLENLSFEMLSLHSYSAHRTAEMAQKFDLHYNIILYMSNSDEIHARQRDECKMHRKNFTLS